MCLYVCIIPENLETKLAKVSATVNKSTFPTDHGGLSYVSPSGNDA